MQQHGGTGVSLAFSPAAQSSIFYPRDHIEDCQPVQYSLLDGEAQHLPYRSLIALDVIIEIEWKESGLIIVETRSLVTYNWLLNKDRRPWSQQTTLVDMERRLACVGEVAFSKAEQHANEMAETLLHQNRFLAALFYTFSGPLTSTVKNAAIDSVANICSAFRNQRR
ncbi:hypothetical protein Goari_011777 [Gossypium aridum]|uniref:RNase H type-1 domain-containing protein n=1 Tax=Gossypium aridum TaxID=34290 RepID=A0A7J8WYV1_GOSAI|nr:hypothetical protein [Gossypium aridum]